MPTRTSTRQAAVKANQAFTHTGSKRKGSTSGQLQPKKGKKDVTPNEGNNYQKPFVTEEGQETKSFEDPSHAQATVNKQPTEAPPKNIDQPAQEDGVKDEDEEANKGTNGEFVTRIGVRARSLIICLGETTAVPSQQEEEKTEKRDSSQTAVKVSSERESDLPSNILEKGIIYFFFRPRVNVEEPHSITDVARSFFVLRPIPKGAKLEDGPIGDDNNCRLIMLPKKKYPSSGRERDMGFVEKAQVSLKTIREQLMETETHETKTRGERITPEARPYAEGVYALIKEGRNSHLAYILTIPQQLGDIQRDFGLHDRGSFVIQSKNPEYAGPTYAQLPQGPEYPAK